MLASPAWTRGSIAALIVLAAATLALFAWLPQRVPPAEDAVILFRYAEHLSSELGIVYNANGPRAEGATDFGWMVLLSLGRWVGSTFGLALALSVAATWVTGFLLWRIAGTRDRRWLLAAVALVLFSPAVGAAVRGFSVFFSGAFVAAILLMAMERNSRGLYLACLAGALIRPDAAVLAAPLALADLLRSGDRARRWRDCLLLLIAPGVTFFAWRWWYFGLPLPLPFYVKVLGAQRVGGLFVTTSLAGQLRYAVMVGPLALVAMRHWRSWPKLAPLLLLASAFVFYSVASLEQNVSSRFEYPMLLAVLALAAVDLRAHGMTRRLAIGAAVTLCLWLPETATNLAEAYESSNEQPIADLARSLRELPRGKLATTEAGRLAYYSDWEVTDLWGLNDPVFARHFVQPEDVAALGADLVVMYPNLDLVAERAQLEPQPERGWVEMLANILIGMGDDYELWLVPFERPPRNEGVSRAYQWLSCHAPLQLIEEFGFRSLYRLTGDTAKLAQYDAYIARSAIHRQRLDVLGIRKDGPLADSLRAVVRALGGHPVDQTTGAGGAPETSSR